MLRNTTITEDLVPPGAKIDKRNLELVEKAYHTLLEAIGEDVDRQGLRRTPVRAARALEFLTHIGRAHVAYIPNGKVIGLSKVARIVDVYARRLQIQENLTTQIAESLMSCLEPAGVAVVVEAKHLCMMMRGVEKQNSVMKTSCLLGSFKDDARTRSEFLSLLKE